MDFGPTRKKSIHFNPPQISPPLPPLIFKIIFSKILFYALDALKNIFLV